MLFTNKKGKNGGNQWLFSEVRLGKTGRGAGRTKTLGVTITSRSPFTPYEPLSGTDLEGEKHAAKNAADFKRIRGRKREKWTIHLDTLRSDQSEDT